MMTNVGMFDEIKKIDEIKTLKKRNKELIDISKKHQKLIGELLQENKILKEDIDRLTEERDNFEILAKNNG
jgi:DNA repair ATPase RecN